MIISKDIWHVCKICNKHIKDLAKIYGGHKIYYSEVFRKHLLNEHNIQDIDYFSKYDIRKTCDCGICNKLMNLNKKPSSNFSWSKPCGRYHGTLKWSEDAKISRCGKNNPMYKKIPWNKNKKFDDIIRNKMRASAIQRIQNGDFKFTNTRPHRIFNNILKELNIEYETEKLLGKYLYDTYIPKYNIAIEIDGDYYHCNPVIYKSGPINDVQKKNIIRDKYKNDNCKNLNIVLLRFWEYDLYNNLEDIKCTLKKLLQLES